MAQKDWIEILNIIKEKDNNYISSFLQSNDTFAPSKNFYNILDEKDKSSDFNKVNLNKDKPSNWIPLYNKSHLPEIMIKNKLSPIRSGQGSFFFYKGDIFFNTNIKYINVNNSFLNISKDKIPLSLISNFQKNENGYINKALALNIINNFIEEDENLMYGQFGKIKTSKDLIFKTSKDNKRLNKGLQFEIDMLLESSKEIFIFEAKTSNTFTKNFSLLQLYYPLVYVDSIIKNKKKIRTIFIDITTKENKEIYRLIELKFKEKNFDILTVEKSSIYTIDKFN